MSQINGTYYTHPPLANKQFILVNCARIECDPSDYWEALSQIHAGLEPHKVWYQLKVRALLRARLTRDIMTRSNKKMLIEVNTALLGEFSREIMSFYGNKLSYP